MNFQIKHRFNSSIIFECECGSLKVCIEKAISTGTDLRDADLRDAYLRGADGKKIKIEKTPLQILNLYWDIIIFDAHMKIGCEFHTISDWKKYDADRISKMDSHAIEWWKVNKESIFAFCAANERI